MVNDNLMFILILFLFILLLLFVFVIEYVAFLFLHELGHYLAYKKHGADPKFGFCFLKNNLLLFALFVMPLSGSTFYIPYYMKDEKNAWKKELILSGSGLGVSLILGIIFSILFRNYDLPNNPDLISYLIYYTLLSAAVFNVLIFIANFIGTRSDGWRIVMALIKRKNYAQFLIDIKYSFNGNDENLQKAIKRIQEKYNYKKE